MVWSVSKIAIINLSFNVSTSKNKSIDYQSKETCAIISTQVTYERDHISVLREFSVECSKFLFFYEFYCNLKKQNHSRKIKKKLKKKMLIRGISIILIYQKLESVEHVQQKISCLCLKPFKYYFTIYIITISDNIFLNIIERLNKLLTIF